MHRTAGALMLTLLATTAILYTFSILPPKFVKGAESALVWNPYPFLVTGDLVLAAIATAAAGLLIWPLTNKNILQGADLELYNKWQSIEEKWLEPVERADFNFVYEATEEGINSSRVAGDRSTNQDEAWFVVLNVERDATPEDIRRAFREAMQRYHPDKVANLGEKLKKVAEEESKRINAAFSAAKHERGFV